MQISQIFDAFIKTVKKYSDAVYMYQYFKTNVEKDYIRYRFDAKPVEGNSISVYLNTDKRNNIKSVSMKYDGDLANTIFTDFTDYLRNINKNLIIDATQVVLQ